MISLDIKAETASSSTLSLSTPSDEPAVPFAEFLKNISEKKDGKVVQNGSLILSLGANEKETDKAATVSKADTLLSLLKGEDALAEKKEEAPLELHPKLTANLSTKEIKTLVSQAKNYLKNKIIESDDFKRSEIKELPKTLKGLATVAKKFGIDVTKITFEEVKAHVEIKHTTKKFSKHEEIKTSTLNDDKQSIKKELKAQSINNVEQEIDIKIPQAKKVATQDIKEAVQVKKATTQDIKEAVQDKKTTAQDIKEVTQDKKVAPSDIKEVIKEKPVAKTEIKNDKIQASHLKDTPTNTPAANAESSKDIRRDEKVVQIPKELKATPLFKAQAAIEHTTTEQIVQAKTNSLLKVEQKTPKDRADETLKLLLRGEKPSMSNPALTADFSVATAKVIAPSATSEAARSLEALLHGESSSEQSTTPSKTEGFTIHKADSFEVKLNEAKQMIKYLSNDIKTAIEDYKSPFTRVKVQLNPQKLGDVDLTVVQRGKNLHVNISSNNTAVNTLAMNANELRVQLSNNGINNATLNFNNGSQSGDSSNGQQQNRHNEQKANEEYNYFENEEANEEILSSLEIVVPNYA